MGSPRDWEKVKGEVYSRLTVLGFAGQNSKGNSLVEARCECGEVVTVPYHSIKTGNTKSCGCLQVSSRFKHGLSYEPLFRVWKAMVRRCTVATCKGYKDYGERGITVCEAWLASPSAFVEWGKANGCRQGLDLDRIDNDAGYSPDNCRFVTRGVNQRNSRLIQTNNTSGFRGVHAVNKGYKAQVKLDNKHAFQKQGFKTAKEAAIYRDMYCIEHGIETVLNFPELKEAYERKRVILRCKREIKTR